MAVAAYASVLSLMRALDNVLLPSRCWLLPEKTQIETLQQKLGFLQDSLEVLHSSSKEVLLEADFAIRQIHEVVNEADHVIDKYVVDRLRGAGYEEDQITGKICLSSSFYRYIEELIEKIESINQDLMVTAKDRGRPNEGARLSRNSFPVGSSTTDSTDKNTNTMVGFEDHLVRIMDMLTGSEPSLQIIPIVGMGGIGKTTLAQNAFDNKCIVEHFDVRIWLTISQEYDVMEILLELERNGVLGNQKGVNGLIGLGTSMYKKLFGARYLVVMDDVWNTRAWDDFKPFFPNNGNRSRIMMTTRLLNVADSLGPYTSYSMSFLDEEKSRKLFHEKAFCNGGWSSDLEEIGKKIVRNCGGLPLTLVVIGGLLANSGGTRKFWELVAEELNSFSHSAIDENCLKVLSLSYDHLPIHLKSCFLYMGGFREDSDIRVSELVESWVAEGIVKPTRKKRLEEIAIEYLNDLISRNMVLIRELGSRGNVKTCGIHDLLRQLSIRQYHKERFSISSMTQKISFSLNDAEYPQLDGLRSIRLMKVNDQLVKIPQTTNSQYLSIGGKDGRGHIMLEFSSPSSISLLWNLQVLYYDVELSDVTVLLSNIWEMPQLRHLNLNYQVLPDTAETKDSIVLQYLQTLKTIQHFRCTEEVVRRIPNIKKLSAFYTCCFDEGQDLDWSYYCLKNLTLLQKLQSLTLSCPFVRLDIESIAFPCSLKKLTLISGRVQWKYMKVVGSLPNLEVLKLYDDAFVGDEWCTFEGQFPRLKYLKIQRSDLVFWRAECSHFPVLETLILVGMFQLECIPVGIGDIETLGKIHVESCCESAVNSVKEILKEQESYGNQILQVHVVDGDMSMC